LTVRRMDHIIALYEFFMHIFRMIESAVQNELFFTRKGSGKGI